MVTEKKVKQLIWRLGAIRANAPQLRTSDDDHALLGAQQALLCVAGKPSHFSDWLERYENEIREFHKKAESCDCGVCREEPIEQKT